MRKAPVPVLYVAGFSRSGSTLLDRVLGAMPDYFSLGEFRHAWARGYANDELCGCGAPFQACAYWTDVRALVEKWAGRNEKARLERLRDNGLARTELLKSWTMINLRKTLRADGSSGSQGLLRLLGHVYAAMLQCSGARVLVDSSKSALYARILAHVETIELKVLHVTRDSRAVAYSMKRKRRRPEIQLPEAYMPTFSTWRASCEWLAGNALAQLLRVSGNSVPYYRMPYEEFVRLPKETLGRALGSLGYQDQLNEVFVSGSQVRLTAGHTVSGNPMRFKTGILDIRADDEWRTAMAPIDRVIASLLTWPLLALYGYPLRSSVDREPRKIEQQR